MINKKRIAKTATALLTAAMLIQAVPAHADSVHVAKEGDTFYTLSKQYGVGLNALIKANNDISAYNIYGGLKITIPGKTTNTVSAAAAKTEANTITTASLDVNADSKVVQAWGKTFDYSKAVDVKATAYSADASENGGWGAVDYFGNPLELGTIAVDPSIIPLGTKVLVTGHTHPGLPKQAFVATARDVGSAIKGHKIDIFIPGSKQSVSTFGIQDVELYILK
ncbi:MULTISPECIES: 3D domain-containing protein [Paenibacillus]|uniref:3D (Asp-Asp-Asp) domain-containing protein n=1 Tax=Paenibacillus pabuli TaxID=1472 RepID=A0A855XU61_9BACL|nr:MULTISPECIES: 3D domain-containing protein [Paenibacillus]PWW36035.1 3D (Asp-Asp-Asp) domain-containing protein [Paenibacillus pabuli]PXW03114.1 3D (Asp-Asp-Asp) domain-containing protein [Paenibacillus taichungensis]SEL25341.1 3D (Asp-Asp-Asp) domain-containing protein [Paenibacillus sp. OK003]